MVKKTSDSMKLIVIAYVFVTSILATYYTKYFITNGVAVWYHFVYQPSVTPPDSLYSIIWMIYNIAVGAAFIKIILELDSIEFPKYNYPYLANLILEFLWSYSFFWCRQVGWAMFIVIPMVILTFKTIIIYKDGDPIAAKISYVPFIITLYMALVSLAMVNEHGLKVEIYQ